ncbi:MAG: phosphatase PAP2 family protein [Bacteroidia bacterium]|nr:phosphatase PAP2 family protein [Bacteroidia bacterium]MDW8134607.1 phosphatase PAP2 family protein [Bacteroidia bacterium]
MKEALQEVDIGILLWLNGLGKEPWDTLVWYATQTWVWLPLFFIGLLWNIHREGKKAWVSLLLIGAAPLSADLITSKILKPWIGRPRPTHECRLAPAIRVIRGYKGGKYSFPSSHAANSMALACTFSFWARHPLVWAISLTWAFFHSLTRIYLGVHYPSDILGGWFVGFLISVVLLAIFRRLND